MSFLLGNKEPSLIEDATLLFLYGTVSYWRDRGLASSRKEDSQKSKSGSNYSTDKESGGIGGKLTIPSKQSNRSNDDSSQDTTPKEQRLCCPSCGARLSMAHKKLNIPKGTEYCVCKGVGCKKCGGKGYFVLKSKHR